MNLSNKLRLGALVLVAFSGVFAQTLQRGVSVQLPITDDSLSIPNADKQNALIATVTRDGHLYIGSNPVSPNTMAETIKRELANQTEKKLYIKADANAPFADVVKVVDAGRTAGVEGVTFLTTQPISAGSGHVVLPQGLEMRMVSGR